MNPDFLKQEEFKTSICCPLCQRDLVMNWQRDNIPYFGEIMHVSARCQCSFRFADTMILSSKEPMRYEMPVENWEDLDARVQPQEQSASRKWGLLSNPDRFQSLT